MQEAFMKTGIVLEGGALRTIFSTGVCDALLDAELMPDYVIGVSAGIAYGVSYVSRQKQRNLQIVCRYANDRRYMGARNLLDPENRSYFGLEFAYEVIPNQLVPFDFNAFEAYPGEVEAVVTNLNTGRADYLPVPRRDAHFDLLKATCALPILFPIIHLNGQPYLDGGCADGIPWRQALERGCDRILVVLTRERDYIRGEERIEKLIEREYRRYPKFLDTMRRRAEDYNESRRQLFDLEREGRALVIAPRSTKGFSRTERDLDKIRALWQDGYFQGRAAVPAVRTLWQGDCL
jgi:predicted patatin/cPLA2 family phospholipase